MSTRSVPLRVAEPQGPKPHLIQFHRRPASARVLRMGFWPFGILLAAMQAWAFRYYVSADAISYLDMSDGVMPGGDWHRLINGVWSPLYPFLLGAFRRTFDISPANEIVAGHVLNLAFFLFAFACFEFLLRTAVREINTTFPDSPLWIYVATAYALFLWASLSMITLASLRADMLMSGFVYLATAILLRMKGCEAAWTNYCLLGAVLGVGILAKQVMLPLGVVILTATFFSIKARRSAVRMLLVALLVFLALGSLYFLPLSLSRGYFSLGESARFNYLVYVDHARPMWYLQDPGVAAGRFAHSPQKIYSNPAAYAFPHSSLVTHPLRFDPSDWIAGVRPRFAFRAQARGCLQNIRKLARFLPKLSPALLLLIIFAVTSRTGIGLAAFKKAWPIWLVGAAGCAMYVPLHVEARYVGAFIAIFFVGMIFSLGVDVRGRRILASAGIVAVVGLCAPILIVNSVKCFASLRDPNADAQAAMELTKFGIGPGDKVARISPTVTDLGIERIARLEVVAEVGIGDSRKFWTSPSNKQNDILKLFALNGAKAVIATLPPSTARVIPQWIHLGSTRYWVWLANSATDAAFRASPQKF